MEAYFFVHLFELSKMKGGPNAKCYDPSEWMLLSKRQIGITRQTMQILFRNLKRNFIVILHFEKIFHFVWEVQERTERESPLS